MKEKIVQKGIYIFFYFMEDRSPPPIKKKTKFLILELFLNLAVALMC